MSLSDDIRLTRLVLEVEMPYTDDPDAHGETRRVKDEVDALIPDDPADKSNLDRLRDVTADLELTETLYLRAREYFETLAGISDDGVAILLDGRIVYANKRMALILAAPDVAALKGRDITAFVHHADRGLVDEAQASSATSEVTARLVPLDGTIRRVRIRRYVLVEQEGTRLTVVRLLDEGEAAGS